MPCDHTVDPTVSWCAPSSPVRVSTKPEQRVLTGADCPTAMFVSSDLQAFGVLRAIRERALDVPP
jgi:DNA-binding LacI/PurR family transcriptional regulator